MPALSNLRATWTDSLIRYDAISMNVNAQAYAANSNLLAIRNNDALKFKIDATGNTQIGSGSQNIIAKFTVTETVGSTVGVFGNGAGISIVSNWPNIGFNAYYDGGWKTLANGYSGTIQINQNNGGFDFLTSSNNNNGRSVDLSSLTTRMVIANTGNVGIGTSNPQYKLDVAGTANISNLIVVGNVSARGFRANGGAPGPFGNNNNGYAFTGTVGDNDSGMFSEGDGNVNFYINSTEKMRLNSNGLSIIDGTFNGKIPHWTVYWDKTAANRTTPNTFTKSATGTLMSYGDIHLSPVAAPVMTGSVMYEMWVYAPSSTTAMQFIVALDDNVYFHLNGGLIQSNTASAVINANVSWNLVTGNNLVQIVFNNSGGGSGTLQLIGDFFIRYPTLRFVT
jgi:hypothetical protein